MSDSQYLILLLCFSVSLLVIAYAVGIGVWWAYRYNRLSNEEIDEIIDKLLEERRKGCLENAYEAWKEKCNDWEEEKIKNDEQ